jgi:hypothetical protein
MGRKIKDSAIIARDPFDAEATLNPREDQSNARALAALERKKLWIDPVEEIAENKIKWFNYQIQALRECSRDPVNWVVSEFYPNAKGDPLYVDRPKNKVQEKFCLEKKKPIMEKLGLRYHIHYEMSLQEQLEHNVAESRKAL